MIVESEGADLWVNLGRPIVTNGDTVALLRSCVKATHSSQISLGEDLMLYDVAYLCVSENFRTTTLNRIAEGSRVTR